MATDTLLWGRMNASMAAYEASIENHLTNAMAADTLLWGRMNASMAAYEASIENHLTNAMAAYEASIQTHLASALAAQNRLERHLVGALDMVEQIHLLVYSAMAGVTVCVALQLALLVLWLRRKRSDPTFVFV